MSLKETILPVLALTIFYTLQSCATAPKIESEINPEIQIDSYKAFSLLPLPKSIPGASPGSLLRYGSAAQKGIIEALSTKGYQNAASVELADFTINIKASIVPKVNITDWGYDYGYYRRPGFGGYPYGYAGSDIDVDTYEEGTLIIEIFDTTEKQLAWVGWATARKKSTPMETDELKELIKNILEDFPNQYESRL